LVVSLWGGESLADSKRKMGKALDNHLLQKGGGTRPIGRYTKKREGGGLGKGSNGDVS